MAFIDQVQDLTSLTVEDNDELSQFLKDGAIDVTNRWLAVKPQDIEQFARESAETTSNASLDLSGAQVISVIREDGVTSNNWRSCRQISPSQQYLVTNTESLSFASKFNPTYMIGDNGKISVFPAPGADPNAFKAYYVNNSPEESDGSALRYTSANIKYFPDDKVYLVVIYAGIRLIHATLADKSAPSVPVSQVLPALNITATDPTAISLTTVNYNSVLASTSTALTSFTAPTYIKPIRIVQSAFSNYTSGLTETDPGIFSLNAVAPSVPTISSQVVADPSSFAPTYIEPVTSLTAAPTISNLSVTSVPPATPSLTSVTFTSIDAALDASIPVFTTATIGSASTYTGSAPAYTKPAMALGPVPSLTTVAFTSIDSALDASAAVFTTATVNSASTYTGSVPTYTKPTMVLGSAPTISNLSVTAVPPDSVSDTISDFSLSSDFTDAMANAETFFDDEDTEMVTSAIQRAQIALQQSLNTFNSDMQKFQASGTGKFGAEVAAYQAEVNMQVQEYQQNLAGDIQVWQAERQTDLQKYSTDVQNEVNEFNKENAAYQSAIQESMQEVQIANQVNLAKAQADLQLAMANKDRDQQRQLQNGINDMKAIVDDNSRKVASWQAERQTDLQKYGSDIQNELNEFNKENVAYQSAIQESTQELQVSNQVNLAKAQADLQAATGNKDRDQQRQLQNGINDMQAIINDNNRKVSLYQTEISFYSAQVTKEVQEYQQNLAGDIQVWQAERQTDLQKYGSDIQNSLNTFNKENVKYQAIVQEYIQEAQLLDEHEARKLQKYQVEVGTYQADVGKIVQEYQQKLAQYQLELNTSYQAWAKTESDNIQAYQSDVQNELNKFNEENASFQYEIQKAITDAQSANQVALQNGAQEARDAIENNNAQVTRFQSMAQHYATQVNEDVQKYTVQVQGLSADIQASIAEHGAELQGTQAEYQWLQDQYARLKAEYDQAFMIAAPKQQAAPAAA